MKLYTAIFIALVLSIGTLASNGEAKGIPNSTPMIYIPWWLFVLGAILLILVSLGSYALATFNARRRHKAEIQDLQSLHELFIDNMPAFVYTLDIDNESRYTSCNQACLDLWNLTREEAIGKNNSDIFGKEQGLFFQRVCQVALNNDKLTEQILPYTAPYGKERQGIFYHKRLNLSNNRHWLFGFGLDITELNAAKRAAEENAEWLKRTINAIGDGVITTDASGRVTMINPVAERMLGVNKDDAAGRKHEEIFQITRYPDDKPAPSPITQTINAEKNIELVSYTKLKSLNGKEFHISGRAAPIHNANGEIIGAILVFRDVTKRDLQRDKLREAHTSLEFALEMSKSASFRLNIKTHKVTGSKLLHELMPIKDGLALSRKEFVHPNDLEEYTRIGQKILSGEIDEALWNYRAFINGELRHYRIRARVDSRKADEPVLVGVLQDDRDYPQCRRA